MGNQKLYKGSLQTIILKLLETNDKMYGYEITQQVKELNQGRIANYRRRFVPRFAQIRSRWLARC